MTGLTAAGHVDFVAASGCYDEVLSYVDLARLTGDAPTVVVDFAGQPALLEQLQHRLGDRLTDLVRVGQTHWDSRPAGTGDLGELGGDAPSSLRPPRFNSWSPHRGRASSSGNSRTSSTVSKLRSEAGSEWCTTTASAA